MRARGRAWFRWGVTVRRTDRAQRPEPLRRPAAAPQTPAPVATPGPTGWQPKAGGVRGRPPAQQAQAPAQAQAVGAATDTFSRAAVSPEQLRRIMPGLSAERAEALAPHLNRAMKDAGIDTPQRAAMFLAQLGHESGGLRHFEELASGRAYEGRRDLGNLQPGDGVRFKGRGPIQLTGRANYAAASKALGIDLVNNPELAARPDVGFKVAAWYWSSRGLNQLADQGRFDAITQRINGGQNGAADRHAYLARANAALGGGFGGGPLATGSTPIPSTDAPERSYGVRRGATRDSAAPGFTRMADSYAQRAQMSQELFFFLLLELILGVDLDALAENPDFQAFAQAAGANWQKGQPVPESLAAEFMAHQLAARVEAGEDPRTAAQAVKAALAAN